MYSLFVQANLFYSYPAYLKFNKTESVCYKRNIYQFYEWYETRYFCFPDQKQSPSQKRKLDKEEVGHHLLSLMVV